MYELGVHYSIIRRIIDIAANNIMQPVRINEIPFLRPKNMIIPAIIKIKMYDLLITSHVRLKSSAMSSRKGLKISNPSLIK